MGSLAMWGAVGGAGRAGESYIKDQADRDWKTSQADIDFEREKVLARIRGEEQRKGIQTSGDVQAETVIPAATEGRIAETVAAGDVQAETVIPARTEGLKEVATHQGGIESGHIRDRSDEVSRNQWERQTWQEHQNALQRQHEKDLQRMRDAASKSGSKASETILKHQLDRFEKGDLTEEILLNNNLPMGGKNLPGVYDRDTGTWYSQHGNKLMYASDGDRKPGTAPTGGVEIFINGEKKYFKEGEKLPEPSMGHIEGLAANPDQVDAFYDKFGFIPRIYLSALRNQALNAHFGTGSE